MKNGSFRIGEWTCHPGLNRISRGDRQVQVEPKVMQVLLLLADRPGELCPRQEILDTVWAGTAVSEQVLSRAVSELRKIFGDDSRSPTVIETIAKSGYRLLLPVKPVEAVEPMEAPASVAEKPAAASRSGRPGWSVAVALGLVGMILGALLFDRATRERPGASPPLVATELSVLLPAGSAPDFDFHRAFDLSPDGRLLVYNGVLDGRPQLYLRPLDRDRAQPIAGAEGGYGPFFSPDSHELGFYAEGRLRRISLPDGEPVTIFEDASDPLGASWGPDGSIVFTRRILEGLWIKPAAEAARALTRLEAERGERSHFWPHHLPGGTHLLFTVWTGGGINDCRIDLLELSTGERKMLIAGGADARYAAGRILFARGLGLMEAPFDLQTMALTAAAQPLVEGLWAHPISGAAHYAVSRDGTLVYYPVSNLETSRSLNWVDPTTGSVERASSTGGSWAMPRLSPDGTRLATTQISDGLQVWIRDLDRGTEERLTNRGQSIWPLWSPDDRDIVFSSERDGSFNLYRKPARGEDAAARLTTGPNMQFPGSFHPDGSRIAFSDFHPDRRWDIWILPLDPPGEPVEFLATQFDEFRPTFSPDGELLAYVSNESGRWDETGRWEVYIRPLVDPNSRVQVSLGGGVDPAWSKDGRSLYFRRDDRLYRVAVQRRPVLAAGDPVAAVDTMQVAEVGAGVPAYDIAHDDRVLVVRSGRASVAAELRVVQGAFHERK